MLTWGGAGDVVHSRAHDHEGQLVARVSCEIPLAVCGIQEARDDLGAGQRGLVQPGAHRHLVRGRSRGSVAQVLVSGNAPRAAHIAMSAGGRHRCVGHRVIAVAAEIIGAARAEVVARRHGLRRLGGTHLITVSVAVGVGIRRALALAQPNAQHTQIMLPGRAGPRRPAARHDRIRILRPVRGRRAGLAPTQRSVPAGSPRFALSSEQEMP